MIENIIYTLCLMLPSAIFGYCVRWMIEEEQIAKQILANKQKRLLEQQNQELEEINKY